jgi:predicted negative regulator of RcsB-dependent stress response
VVRLKLFWILAAFGLLLAALFIWRQYANAELESVKEQSAQMLSRIETISRLRNEWEKNPSARSRLENLFNSDSYKRLGTISASANGVKAELSSLDARLLNHLTRQLFESPVVVKTFVVTRKGDEAADVSLEIVW